MPFGLPIMTRRSFPLQTPRTSKLVYLLSTAPWRKKLEGKGKKGGRGTKETPYSSSKLNLLAFEKRGILAITSHSLRIRKEISEEAQWAQGIQKSNGKCSDAHCRTKHGDHVWAWCRRDWCRREICSRISWASRCASHLRGG